MDQSTINNIAKLHKLEVCKQHQGSDGFFRFYLTQELSIGRYLQASVSYPCDSIDLKGKVRVHAGLYAERKLADDGTLTYDSLELAIEGAASRFERLLSF
jgi:hypothetical protein